MNESNKIYYTIFLGNDPWINVIDDMNTTESWSQGMMVWDDKDKACDCMEVLKNYDFETETKKFQIVEMITI